MGHRAKWKKKKERDRDQRALARSIPRDSKQETGDQLAGTRCLLNTWWGYPTLTWKSIAVRAICSIYENKNALSDRVM